ncbi:hypothetical protein ACCO45_000892 [Purpureocillium lilacinum]|uniref:Uncharacterized protein n=1 Tax=Purpureocillium lilacinum TaxID=33203 RepID=A0ACC4E6P0_PURLI
MRFQLRSTPRLRGAPAFLEKHSVTSYCVRPRKQRGKSIEFPPRQVRHSCARDAFADNESDRKTFYSSCRTPHGIAWKMQHNTRMQSTIPANLTCRFDCRSTGSSRPEPVAGRRVADAEGALDHWFLRSWRTTSSMHRVIHQTNAAGDGQGCRLGFGGGSQQQPRSNGSAHDDWRIERQVLSRPTQLAPRHVDDSTSVLSALVSSVIHTRYLPHGVPQTGASCCSQSSVADRQVGEAGQAGVGDLAGGPSCKHVRPARPLGSCAKPPELADPWKVRLLQLTGAGPDTRRLDTRRFSHAHPRDTPLGPCCKHLAHSSTELLADGGPSAPGASRKCISSRTLLSGAQPGQVPRPALAHGIK